MVCLLREAQEKTLWPNQRLPVSRKKRKSPVSNSAAPSGSFKLLQVDRSDCFVPAVPLDKYIISTGTYLSTANTRR